MAPELILLGWNAAAVGFIHALLGPDHYLPFVAMSRAGGWSVKKTAMVTLCCGLGHVASSTLLGMVGIAAGLAATHFEAVEAYRGRLAAWLLVAFGLVYAVWGLRRAHRRPPHQHLHAHADGVVHAHLHVHEREHVHAHDHEAPNRSSRMAPATPWVLFTIFIFGPCEPLIPLIMYPAAQKSLSGVVLVLTVFGLVTLATMLLAVLALLRGVARLPFAWFGSHAHTLAGITLVLCGLAIQFLGV